jgi:hypothetical protein
VDRSSLNSIIHLDFISFCYHHHHHHHYYETLQPRAPRLTTERAVEQQILLNLSLLPLSLLPLLLLPL